MINLVSEYSTFAQAYQDALITLNEFGNTVKVRDYETKELQNFAFTVNKPEYCVFESKIRSSNIKYIAAELLWYMSGNRNPDFIKDYAKLWDVIRNPDGTVNSNYGYLVWYDKISQDSGRYINTQFEWALSSLIKDEYSRQAIIHFNNKNHQYDGVKDFVCTMYANFHIRDNKLNMQVRMRSSDAIFGLINDFPFFSFLHGYMHEKLSKFYKKLKCGSITLQTDSWHIYSRHYNVLNDFIKYFEHTDLTPYKLSFPFIGNIYDINIDKNKNILFSELNEIGNYLLKLKNDSR